MLKKVVRSVLGLVAVGIVGFAALVHMDGAADTFVGKSASLFFDMDKLVGSDFERGLATMKANAEASAPVAGAASSLR